MKTNPSILKRFIVLNSLLLLSLLLAGCGAPVFAPAAALPTNVAFNFEFGGPSLPPGTPAAAAPDGTLVFRYRVDCSCGIDDAIRAEVVLIPGNGTPPYQVPGYRFVESYTFDGALGDVYHLVVKSSDRPPLSWEGDIRMACDLIPVCSTPASPPPPTLAPGVDPANRSARGGAAPTATLASGAGATENPVTVEPPADEPHNPPGIPDCPPPSEGGEPPGLCKKK